MDLPKWEVFYWKNMTGKNVEIDWGIPLDRTNGAKPFNGVDCVVFKYAKPIKEQDGPVLASELQLSPLKIMKDLYITTSKRRRDILGTLNEGQRILRRHSRLDATDNSNLLTSLIAVLSASQNISRRVDKDNPTDKRQRIALIKACIIEARNGYAR